MTEVSLILYTVGHGNMSAEAFLELLRRHSIAVLVDVRSAPYSKYVPHFSKDRLEPYLNNQGVDYRYAGQYLGGRPDDPTVYYQQEVPDEETGRSKFLKLVDYKAVMGREWYQKGLRRLVEIVQQTDGRVSIMCSEIHPQECHRHHLITRSLLDPQMRLADLPEVQVIHILSSGDLQPVDPAEFDKGPQQLSLF
jgi:uncharacterized protein (DUF488 family)